MTTVAGFEVDELAAQIVLAAVAGRPERRHNIVDIGTAGAGTPKEQACAIN